MGLRRLSASERRNEEGSPDLAVTGPARPLQPRIGLLIALAVAYAVCDLGSAALDGSSVSQRTLTLAAFLTALGAGLSLFSVRLPVGYITLSGIATSAGALTLSPRPALLVGVLTGTVMAAVSSRSTVIVRLSQPLAVGLWTTSGSWLNAYLVAAVVPAVVREPMVVAVVAVANLLLTGLTFVGILRMGLGDVLKRNASTHWVGAFAYFGVASILMANVLDGSARGFLLAVLVAVLSLALGDSVAGRELRVRLQAQLRDAERYVLHSRVVEGTIHDVRNFLAVGLGQLDELITQPTAAGAELARTAFRDAVDSLGRLQMGSNPQVEWSPDPLDLSILARDVVSRMRAAAAQKRVVLEVRGSQPIWARGDPLLLRQVVTNLVLNSIEAVAAGGHVRLEVASHSGKAMLSVADDGPGVPEKYRDRLFEPHFTTKSSGSGIGLFVSYGIVRQHGGQLLYNGGPNGAIFTVVLPLSE